MWEGGFFTMLDMITHKLSGDFETLQIYPINDLHVGEKSCDKERFRAFVKFIAETPNAYTVLVGDLLNNAIVSSVSNTYEEDMTPSEAKKWLREELRPIKNKILAVVSGNHEYRSAKSTDTHLVEDICDYLDITQLYRPIEAFVKVTFGKRSGGHSQAYGIYLTHGAGGGKKPGSAVNRIEELTMSVLADIYICGHFHRKIGMKHEYRHTDIIHETVTERERLFVIASHWASSFGGYASQKMLQPQAKGSAPITLYANRKHFEVTI
jgi:predicted phosphodiesterase